VQRRMRKYTLVMSCMTSNNITNGGECVSNLDLIWSILDVTGSSGAWSGTSSNSA
jgi:hypothetical protein